jgi:hypothetical protein
MPTRLIASSLALIAFAVAVLAGIAVDNPAYTIIWRAILAMAICYFVGLFIGAASQHAVEEDIESHRRRHPLQTPAESASPEPGAGAGVVSAPVKSGNVAA